MCGIDAGSLPQSWDDDGALPSLTYLCLQDLPITGTLPPSWGSTAMPALTKLIIAASNPALSHLSGSLPEEWGSPTAFTQLSYFSAAGLSLQGESSR